VVTVSIVGNIVKRAIGWSQNATI